MLEFGSSFVIVAWVEGGVNRPFVLRPDRLNGKPVRSGVRGWDWGLVVIVWVLDDGEGVMFAACGADGAG